jgi:hypothetical protein
MLKKNQNNDICIQIFLFDLLYVNVAAEWYRHDKIAFTVNALGVIFVNLVLKSRIYLSFQVFKNNYIRIIAYIALAFIVLVFFYEILVIFFGLHPVI